MCRIWLRTTCAFSLPPLSFCASGEIDCSVERYLWSSQSLALSALVGGVASILFFLGCVFLMFGKRLIMLEFSPYSRRELAPFVAVLLGWEMGLAKNASKR